MAVSIKKLGEGIESRVEGVGIVENGFELRENTLKFDCGGKLLKCKRGFGFSILALFVAMLLFAFGGFKLFQGNFEHETGFEEARILSLDDELKYFKDTYVRDSLKFSLYLVLSEVMDYSRDEDIFFKLSGNYSRLNDLVFEGLTNGSFDGVYRPNLDSKNMDYLFNVYKSQFDLDYLSNLSFDIVGINVFEETPYFVSVQVIANYSVTTLDDISSWSFLEEFIVSVPVYDLDDPEFLYNMNLSIPLKAAEYGLSDLSWSSDNLNKTLINTYSVVYYDEDYDYTLGSSFLGRLMNSSFGSYKNVVGSFSFDRDILNGGVYDSSSFFNLSDHFGSTRLLLGFENESIVSTNVSDVSAYGNDGEIFGNVSCINVSLFSSNYCQFDGDQDYIQINDSDSFIFNDSFSVSLWVKKSNLSLGDEVLISHRESDVLGWDLSVLGDGVLGSNSNENNLAFRVSDGINTEEVILDVGIEDDVWYFVTGVYNGSSLNLYLDDILQSSSSVSLGSIGDINSDLFIGVNSTLNLDFNGSLDEVVIVSKALSDLEVSTIFQAKKGQFIDYVDSLFGSGIEFDSMDDYVNISDGMGPYNVSDFAVGVWFKLYSLPNSSIYDFSSIVSEPFIVVNSSTGAVGVYAHGVNDINGDSIYWSSNSIDLNKWVFVVFDYDSVLDVVSIYLNGQLDRNFSGKTSSATVINPDKFGGNFSFGNGAYFDGIIDEVWFYNESFSSSEVYSLYRNFDGFGKGCCNYVQIINPNKFGFNDSAYFENVSYTSRLFFNHFIRGIPSPKIELYNLTNFTSAVEGNEYYNLRFDACMMNIYNVFEYDQYSFHFPDPINNVNGSDECETLIRLGLY